jgi:hypothetical protein
MTRIDNKPKQNKEIISNDYYIRMEIDFLNHYHIVLFN